MTEHHTARTARSGICSACGCHNGDWETRCQKCGLRLLVTQAASASSNDPVRDVTAPPAAAQAPAPVAPQPRPSAFPEHVRQELQMRVQEFRSRQSNRSLPLPFQEAAFAGNVVDFPAPSRALKPPAPPLSHPRPRPAYDARPTSPRANQAAAATELPQTQLEFSAPSAPPGPEWCVLPVAPLRLRLVAHVADLACMAAALAAFLIPLPLLGVPVLPDRLFVAALLCGAMLIASGYGYFFLVRQGATPGMRKAGLRLVDFDGRPAPPRLRLWRLIAVVVSGGSFLLGFLWAALDEEELYWHDHMSKTFLTLSGNESGTEAAAAASAV